uniref:rRNA pseudouridine synthase n=1 Tax=Desulfacinum infernum TaxID=35837 RepID=A0A831ZYX3_9BACT
MRERPSGSRTSVRLHKYIAQAGLASRRTAERWILEGRVSVNGAVVTALGTTVDPEADDVRVDGRRVAPVRSREVILLHKPRFCVTTVRDPRGRPTVMDYLRGLSVRVYPVGRLDWDASGALLCTNDGDLANRLMHPAYGVPKVYQVQVQGVPTAEQLAALRRGVPLAEGVTAAARVRLMYRAETSAWVEITLHQGWYRQIKRMGEAVGLPVLTIHRTAYGPIALGTLPAGRWRRLTDQEVRRLREAVSLPREAKAGA